MRNLLLSSAVVFLLSACVSSPLPKGYSGPTATVRDSSTRVNDFALSMFWLNKVDGRAIETSPGATYMANRGSGFSIKSAIIERQIPAGKTTLSIMGSRVFAADLLGLTNRTFAVNGDVAFDAKADTRYIVKGTIDSQSSSVWIEEEKTGKVVTEKITKAN